MQPSARGRLRAADLCEAEPFGTQLTKGRSMRAFAGRSCGPPRCRAHLHTGQSLRSARVDTMRTSARGGFGPPMADAIEPFDIRHGQQLAKRTQRALRELRAFAAESCGPPILRGIESGNMRQPAEAPPIHNADGASRRQHALFTASPVGSSCGRSAAAVRSRSPSAAP